MKDGQRSRHGTLVAALMVTLFGFSLWMGGLIVLWWLLQRLGVSTDFWPMAQTLTSMVTMAAILGGSFVAYRNLAEATRSRHMGVADRLFEELNSPDNIEARRWVFQNLPDDPEEGTRAMTPEGRAAVKLVLNSLDRVAFLTQEGWIHEEMIMPWMSLMVTKAWAKLEPYVDYVSRQRNEPDYYRYARGLAERCRAWRARQVPDAKITWVRGVL